MDTYRAHSKLLHYDYLLDTQPTSENRKREYYRHMHNDYEILFFYNGNVDYVIENQSYYLKNNDILIIKPMVYHGLNVLSADPYERCVFNFAKSILSDEQLKTLEEAGPIYHVEEGNPIRDIFNMLRLSEKTLTEKEFEYMTKSALHNLLSVLHHLPPVKTTSKEMTKLDEIIEYINNHPQLSIDTQMLSKRFFISKSWIDHSLKTYLKMSPKQYINQKKILYAQSLILSGLLPSKVAEMCNYKNYTTFYRQYLYFLGHEPLQDRKDTSSPIKKI